MKNRFVRLLALGGALCLPMSIHAASGSASIQSLQFQLIDLAPDDGIAASLVWDTALAGADASSVFGTSFTFGPGGTWTVSFVDSGSDSVFDPANFLAAATASFAGASASIGSGGTSAQFQTHPNGSSDSASAFSYGAFTLSPMAQLRVSGSLSVAIDGPSGTAFAVPPGTPADHAALHAQSFAYVEVGLNPLTGGPSTGSFESRTLSGENYTQSSNPSLPVDAYSQAILLSPFVFDFVNDTNASATGEFWTRTAASGQQIVSTTSPVPESQVWLSLCVGLGLWGVLQLMRRAPRR
jgi:hypothetical protein